MGDDAVARVTSRIEGRGWLRFTERIVAAWTDGSRDVAIVACLRSPGFQVISWQSDGSSAGGVYIHSLESAMAKYISIIAKWTEKHGA